MTQTLALLIDAYRELNARRMFWISLIISGLVIVGFALLGVTDNGLTVVGLEMPVPGGAARFWYKWAFSTLVIGLWVSKGAMILALISTASIFPDFIAGGSIDLYLSKPISRLRLFATKFAGGLIFVLLQATIFAVGGYFVFGLRAGQWRPAMFLIIPLTTLLFSYLFAVCVLVGVLTRSTLAAILLTVLFWLLCGVGNTTEQGLFAFRTMQSAEARSLRRQADEMRVEIDQLHNRPGFTNFFGIRERKLRERRDEVLRDAEQAENRANRLATAHRIAYGVTTAIPKTGETVSLLDRRLFNDADLAAMREQMDEGNNGGNGRRRRGRGEAFAPPEPESRPTTGPSESQIEDEVRERERARRRQADREAQEEADRAVRGRSVPWILGTSLGFEAVVLGIAAWVFCRRDY